MQHASVVYLALCVKGGGQKSFTNDKTLLTKPVRYIAWAMFNLGAATIRPYGPPMAILEPFLAIFGHI